MPDSSKLSKLSHEELVKRFLSANDIPEDEWPQQTAKLLGFNRTELERALAFYETEIARVRSEIEIASPLWEREEKQRKELSASGHPKLRNWLKSAIEAKSQNPVGEAFVPFQDEVRNETAYDDLYLLYLGLTEIEQLNWNEAIVDVAADFLRDSPRSVVTDGLLYLVECMGELPKLALTSLAPIPLLEAHSVGKISLSPKVALSVFRDGCWRFVDIWSVLFKLGDKIFTEYLEAGMMDDADFTKAGKQVVRQLGHQTAGELAGYVAAPFGWRRIFLAPMLDIPDPLVSATGRTGGLRLGNGDEFRELLSDLTAFASLNEANQAKGSLP